MQRPHRLEPSAWGTLARLCCRPLGSQVQRGEGGAEVLPQDGARRQQDALQGSGQASRWQQAEGTRGSVSRLPINAGKLLWGHASGTTSPRAAQHWQASHCAAAPSHRGALQLTQPGLQPANHPPVLSTLPQQPADFLLQLAVGLQQRWRQVVGMQGGKGMGCCFLHVLGGWGYERGSEGLRGRLVGRRQLHC